MDKELKRLEQKIERLAALSAHLRAENLQLHTALNQAHAENKEHVEKFEQVKSRLEKLLSSLPEDYQESSDS